MVVGLVGLIFLLDGSRGWLGALGTGFAYAFAHFLAGLYWVGNAFTVAGVATEAAPVAVAALAAGSALFPAAACAVYHRLAPRGLWRPAVFASLWLLGEWARGTAIFGGFPWNLSGYVWTPWPAALQAAAVVGVYGLGWLTVFAATSPAALVDGPRAWRAPAVALALLAANGAFGLWVLAGADTAERPDVRLRLVQANVAQHHKGRRDLVEEQLRRHAALSAAPTTDGQAMAPNVVVWPETASPFDLAMPFEGRGHVAGAVPQDGWLIAGAMRVTAGSGNAREVWNSLQALDDDGRVAESYDKFHLVPFGEYVPLRRFLPVAKVTRGSTDFSRGPGPRTLNVPGVPPFSPLICYEAIFPGAVVDPDSRPEWLLNVTNDAWYGVSPGPYQHFEQTRVRAVEEGLPLVRAANTGVSGVIDAYGRVAAKSALGEATVVDAALPVPRPRPTVFSRFGNTPAILFSAAMLAGFAALGRRPSLAARPSGRR